MSILRQQMIRDMELKGLSEKTRNNYIRHVEKFSKYFKQSPENLWEEEIKKYLHFLLTQANMSRSYNAQAYSALKFLYETTMKRDWNGYKIPRSKREKKLPTVLSKDEVKRIFDVTRNIKHRAILMTIYSAGLRVSEAADLKVSDIDSKRMQIRIRDGKGKKERYTLLSKTNLKILREYCKYLRPKEYLFSGANIDSSITPRTIQRVFEQAVGRAGITKDVSVHTLRHSFATHLLDSGADVYHIQRLMGHSSVRTTNIYLHVSQKDSLKLISPLDRIMGEIDE